MMKLFCQYPLCVRPWQTDSKKGRFCFQHEKTPFRTAAEIAAYRRGLKAGKVAPVKKKLEIFIDDMRAPPPRGAKLPKRAAWALEVLRKLAVREPCAASNVTLAVEWLEETVASVSVR